MVLVVPIVIVIPVVAVPVPFRLFNVIGTDDGYHSRNLLSLLRPLLLPLLLPLLRPLRRLFEPRRDGGGALAGLPGERGEVREVQPVVTDCPEQLEANRGDWGRGDGAVAGGLPPQPRDRPSAVGGRGNVAVKRRRCGGVAAAGCRR